MDKASTRIVPIPRLAFLDAAQDIDRSSITIFDQLRNGIAEFHLLRPMVDIHFISPFSSSSKPHLFFAKTALPRCTESLALNKVKHFRILKVTGDGRCMFRALVKGMALNKGILVSPRDERNEAEFIDELRMAVKEVICDDKTQRKHHEQALLAITFEDSLERYCRRIGRSDFWGGEPELLVLSKLYRQPIIVYIPAHEHGSGGSNGFIPIQEYGAEYGKELETNKDKKAVRLLYSGGSHYDLLV